MSSATTIDPESNMLIDGKLVESSTGKSFDNVNPATEEVIGHVTDGSTADMQPCDLRGPPSLRRDRLVDRPRVPQALPHAAPGRPRGREGADA